MGGFDPVSNALLTTVAVLIPMVLVVSVVTHYGVEQPFLRMRRHQIAAPGAMTAGDG